MLHLRVYITLSRQLMQYQDSLWISPSTLKAETTSYRAEELLTALTIP